MGEALGDAPEAVRVAAAREVVARRCDLFNCIGDSRISSLLLAELELVVVRLRNVGLCQPPTGVRYRSEGIEFPALVELEQIAEAAGGWGWTGEDLSRLGQELSGGDELYWLTAEYAEIKSVSGQVRNFYRRH